MDFRVDDRRGEDDLATHGTNSQQTNYRQFLGAIQTANNWQTLRQQLGGGCRDGGGGMYEYNLSARGRVFFRPQGDRLVVITRVDRLHLQNRATFRN